MNKQSISKIVLSGALAVLIITVIIADIFNGSLAEAFGRANVGMLSYYLLNNSTFEKLFMDINGSFSGLIDMNSYYNDIGIYVTRDKYVVSPSAYTSTDYETEQMIGFGKYLDEKGIGLIYVNQPVKYTDDGFFYTYFGTETFSNRNADLFLERITEAGIASLDLRDELVKDEKDVKEMFYRTDHHWTAEGGLWAAGKIAGALNRYAGYDIDLSVYDPGNYSIERYEDWWVGEQGEKLSDRFIGMDDFLCITPDFPTSYYFKNSGVTGTFDGFIDRELIENSRNAEVYKSLHYAYRQEPVINNNVGHGKVLMLCDSYANVCEPFLSLGVSEITPVMLRDYSGSLHSLIESGDFDTVIVCYAQFMIGAHDDESSSNYGMFTFDS